MSSIVETPKTEAELKAEKLAEAIKAGLANGSIALVAGKTKVSPKDDNGKVVQSVDEPYETYKAVNMQGALILAGGSQEELLAMVNSAVDSAAKLKARTNAIDRILGPARKVDAIVKKLVAAGVPDSIARAQVKTMLHLV